MGGFRFRHRRGAEVFLPDLPRSCLRTVPRPLFSNRFTRHVRCLFGGPAPVARPTPNAPDLAARNALHRAPSLGFSPSSRPGPAASTNIRARGPSLALRSTLDVSHVLGGFFRCRLCGFVSPRCRVQGCCRESLLPRKLHRLSPAIALVSFTGVRLRLPAPSIPGPPSGPSSSARARLSPGNG